MAAMLTPRDVAADEAVRTIPLTKGLVALVDADLFDEISRYKWYATMNSPAGSYYARRAVWCRESKSYGRVYLHHAVLQTDQGQMVDHRNGDTLDNRRSNLRLATPVQNAANSRRSRTSTSGYKGISQNRRNGKWIARAEASPDHRSGYIGIFETAEEAARAYDKVTIRLYGEFARPNFPEEAGL